MALHLRIVTPERTLSEEEVRSVTLPTERGEIAVLSMHAAYVGVLTPGMVRVHRSPGVEEELSISGGFVEVTAGGKTLTVLVETAERAVELDAKAIAEAKERAKRAMQNVARHDEASFAAAAAGLQRELARERVLIRFRARRGTSIPLEDKGSISHNENES